MQQLIFLCVLCSAVATEFLHIGEDKDELHNPLEVITLL